jgi:hypothetical protein
MLQPAAEMPSIFKLIAVTGIGRWQNRPMPHLGLPGVVFLAFNGASGYNRRLATCERFARAAALTQASGQLLAQCMPKQHEINRAADYFVSNG